MSTPSQRIWRRRAELDGPPDLSTSAAPGVPETLAGVAERVLVGVSRRAAVADFLDDLRFARDGADVSRRVEAEPQAVEPRTDAYLAALAEHVAAGHGMVVPRWATAQGRFLDHFWWPSDVVGLQAQAIVESPAAFRRRGIFIGATTLQRV